MIAVYCFLLSVALLPISLAVPGRHEGFGRERSSDANGTYVNRNDSSWGGHYPHSKRSKRNAYIYDVFQWPNGRVPYTIDARFNANQRAIILGAINEYTTKTCVRFVDRQPNDVDYVQIILDDTVCGLSTFCKQGGAQFSRIGSVCMGREIVTHELMHSLCFSHEYSRPDRDDYVTIDTTKPDCPAFPKLSSSETTTLDLLFDYVSAQFDEPYFVNGCIVPKLNAVFNCGTGSGNGLSVLDAEKVNAYYKCGGCYSYRFRPLSLITSSDNLVAAGVDTSGLTLYPCRGYYNGDIQIGKSIPSWGGCWIPWGGAERQLSGKFEILTNPKNANLNWQKRPSDGSIPTNAIKGGRNSRRETLYIGRFTMVFNGKSTTIPGTVWKNVCYVSYGGGEYSSTDFDYLVCN